MTRTITSDKQTRKNAVTFQGLWYSNTTSGVGNSLDDGFADGDLADFADGNSALIRIATPAKGDLIEARLTINAVFPFSGVNEFRCYIGKFDTDGVTALGQNATEIARQYKILTGSAVSFYYPAQGNLFVDGLNLMPLIPKRGDAEFNEDGFVIGIELFSKDNPEDFVLYDFKVDCSTQIAEVQK